MAENSMTEGLTKASIEERRSVLHETVAELYSTGDKRGLRLILNSQHPADLADLMHQYDDDDDEQQQLFECLAESVAAGVLSELDIPTMLGVAEYIGAEQLSELVGEMAPDDAADVLGELSQEESETVLGLMDREEADEVRELLTHEEDTGGGIMTSRLLTVREDLSVDRAINYLREWAVEDQVFNIYALDAEGRLSGVVSLRSLILAQPDAPISAITQRDPIAVAADMDQEGIADLFRDYDLVALPVVDDDGHLIGEVTVDDIVAVIDEEATEDMYVMAATSSEEREERSTFGVVRRRIPWLLVCLAGTLMAGAMIDAFQESLSSLTALLFFMPAIMAMGGNAGIQTSTVTIRNLATGELQKGAVLKSIVREMRIALMMGSALGLLAFAVSQLWTGNWIVASCVGLAMVSAVVFSAFLGALVPIVFRGMGVDPAVASGPLITTLNDGISLGIYFTIASVLLANWG
ncbi:MAG: magnesium transporter [Candidatus Latescibacterota bacterium]